MRVRSLAFGLVSAALSFVFATQEAEACSIAGPGVEYLYSQATYQPIPADGVIPIATLNFEVELMEEVQHLSAVIERDDMVVGPAELIAIDLRPPPEPGVVMLTDGLVVARPMVALEPDSAYLLRITRTNAGYSTEEHKLPFTTSAETFTAPAITSTASIAAEHVVVEERMCCDVHTSSCGDSYRCSPTRIRLTPSARIEARIEATEQSQGLVWVARVDSEGALFDRHYPSFNHFFLELYEEPAEAWNFAAANFPLTAASGVHCFVAGITELRSFTELRSEPFCVDTDVEELPVDELREDEPKEGGGGPGRECIGPWFVEDVGDNEDAERGCRIGGGAAAQGLFLVVFACARRRRRRS